MEGAACPVMATRSKPTAVITLRTHPTWALTIEETVAKNVRKLSASLCAQSLVVQIGFDWVEGNLTRGETGFTFMSCDVLV